MGSVAGSCVRSGVIDMRLSIFFIVFFCMTAIVGCAAYQPPNLQPGEMATIYVEPNSPALAIKRIDGREMSSAGPFAVFRHRGRVDLTPGPHAINVEYFNGRQVGGVNFSLVAVAGKTYVIRGINLPGLIPAFYGGFQAWIEDEAAANSSLNVGATLAGSFSVEELKLRSILIADGQGPGEAAKAEFQQQQTIRFISTFEWADAGKSAGRHRVAWKWYNGKQLVDEVSTANDFTNSPFTVLSYIPARRLGLGSSKVELYVDDKLVTTEALVVR